MRLQRQRANARQNDSSPAFPGTRGYLTHERWQRYLISKTMIDRSDSVDAYGPFLSAFVFAAPADADVFGFLSLFFFFCSQNVFRFEFSKPLSIFYTLCVAATTTTTIIIAFDMFTRCAHSCMYIYIRICMYV